MHGDLFLGLLAYNIGPRNGGLRAIMTQYGAHDFVTIQPYLQLLPRDYPSASSPRRSRTALAPRRHPPPLRGGLERPPHSARGRARALAALT
jgi:hypothetical protein